MFKGHAQPGGALLFFANVCTCINCGHPPENTNERLVRQFQQQFY